MSKGFVKNIREEDLLEILENGPVSTSEIKRIYSEKHQKVNWETIRRRLVHYDSIEKVGSWENLTLWRKKE